MPPREAWLACGCPRGEAGIQNIRQRGFALRGKCGVQAVMFNTPLARAETPEMPEIAETEPEAKHIGKPEK